MPICNSGGADGADLHFGEMAIRAGHELRHFTFEGHRSANNEHALVLTQRELVLADPFLKKANKTLQRTFPTASEHTNSLLRRNYWQISDTQAVYAVAPLVSQQVQGGTAWAIQMAMDMGLEMIYLFDTLTSHWYRYKQFPGHWEKVYFVYPPDEWDIYTGIGSRPKNLTTAAYLAIEEVYGFDNT